MQTGLDDNHEFQILLLRVARRANYLPKAITAASLNFQSVLVMESLMNGRT